MLALDLLELGLREARERPVRRGLVERVERRGVLGLGVGGHELRGGLEALAAAERGQGDDRAGDHADRDEGHAPRVRLHDEHEQAAHGHDARPGVEDQRRVQARVAHVEQAVVQVLAVGAEGRLAGLEAPEHREGEVEQRDDEDREGQEDRQERGK